MLQCNNDIDQSTEDSIRFGVLYWLVNTDSYIGLYSHYTERVSVHLYILPYSSTN